MKKVVLMSVFLALYGAQYVSAQSVGQAIKGKKDSLQNAIVNGAINNPVGTVTSVVGFFKHKPKNQTTGDAAASTVQAAAPQNTQAAAPVSTPVVAPTSSVTAASNAGLITGNSKMINNGLTFSIVQCTGDRASQTITVSYTLFNPSKSNQLVVVGAMSSYLQNAGVAIDANGNRLTVSSVSLGNNTARVGLSELPTGIVIRGNIVLINALSTSTNIQYLKIPVASQNEKGGGDKQGTNVEERNIPVTWLN